MKLLDKYSFIIDHSAAKGKQFNDKIREKNAMLQKRNIVRHFWNHKCDF